MEGVESRVRPWNTLKSSRVVYLIWDVAFGQMRNVVLRGSSNRWSILSQITTLGQAPVEGSGPEVMVIEGFAFAGEAVGGRCSRCTDGANVGERRLLGGLAMRGGKET